MEGTVDRSLMFNFPSDTQTYAIDSQFMWSDFLLITPVLKQGLIQVLRFFLEMKVRDANAMSMGKRLSNNCETKQKDCVSER